MENGLVIVIKVSLILFGYWEETDPLLQTVVIGDLFGTRWQKVLLKQQTINVLLPIIHVEEAIPLHSGYTMNHG